MITALLSALFMLSVPTTLAFTISSKMRNIHGPTSSTRLNSVMEVDDSNYADMLLDNHQRDYVLVDVYSKFCGPCKLLEPVLERCSEEWGEKLAVTRVDIYSEDISDLKMEIISQGCVPTKLPTLILFEKGKLLSSRVGVLKDEELNEFLASSISEDAEDEDCKMDVGSPGYVNMSNNAVPDEYMLSAPYR